MLTLAAPSDTVKVWQDKLKTPPAIDLSTGLSVTKGDRFYVEGVGFSTLPQDVQFTLTTTGKEPDVCTATVVGVVGVTWDAYPSNPALDANVAVTVRGHTPSKDDGVRIFPDAVPGMIAPPSAQLDDRRKVLMKATIRPDPDATHPMPRVDVYFRVFDIDDTSAGDEHTGAGWDPEDELGACQLDDNDTAVRHAGDDNRGDGALPITQASTEGPTSNCAVAVLQVSLLPGDNYRAVASLIREKCEDALLAADGFEVAYPAELSPPHSSEPLTVWRRLYIELDSMASPPSGLLPQATSTAIDAIGNRVRLESSAFDSPEYSERGYFSGGHCVIEGVTYAITDSQGMATGLPDWIEVAPGPPPGTVDGKIISVRDDDVLALPYTGGIPSEYGPQVKFRPSFVEAQYHDAALSDNDATFCENVTTSGHLIYQASEKRAYIGIANEQYWSVCIQYAHQPMENAGTWDEEWGFDDGDGDCNFEKGIAGMAYPYPMANVACLFVESARENTVRLASEAPHTVAEKLAASLSHEIGHMFGSPADHSDKGLMAGGARKDWEFRELTLARIRSGDGIAMDSLP